VNRVVDVFYTLLTARAKCPTRRDREFIISSDVLMSVSSCLDATVFKRF